MMIMIMACWWCGQQCANKTFLYNKKEDEKVSLFFFSCVVSFCKVWRNKDKTIWWLGLSYCDIDFLATTAGMHGGGSSFSILFVLSF